MSKKISTVSSQHFFQFETDFVESLHCIPMQVRLKLDTCGVKLKLTHWHQLSQTERKVLIQMPCETKQESQIYRDFLQNLLKEKTGAMATELAIDPHPPWQNQEIPTQVQQKATEFGLVITQAQWLALSQLQRFALIKLSRSSHENKNFLPALQEFGLST